eukprot:XP_014774878.1 PREDICTED: uncharacterized protein LOC106872400 isoform X2 [Octopus bimaculoides]
MHFSDMLNPIRLSKPSQNEIQMLNNAGSHQDNTQFVTNPITMKRDKPLISSTVDFQGEDLKWGGSQSIASIPVLDCYWFINPKRMQSKIDLGGI